jgi:hypothetical protein
MKITNKTWLIAACLGMAIPLAASAGTLASGFDNGWDHSGKLPWGANTDHGSETYVAGNCQWGNNYLTLHSYWNTGGYRYSSAVSYCNTQVPASGYDTVTVSCDIQNPYVGVQGCWPAFWLDTTKSWPPEIDIAEFKGNQGGRVWQNVCNDSQQWQVAQNYVDGNWHTYSVVMGQANGGNRSYQLYLDGSNKMQGTYHDGQNSPFWVICNFAMEGDSGSPGPTYNTYVTYHNFSINTSGSGGGGGGPIANGTYRLQNRADGRMMDNMGSTSDGANVCQWDGSSSNNQKWQVAYSGGYYKLTCVTGGKCLDTGGHTANGSTVQQWGSGGSYNQQWTFTATDSGYYKLVSRASGQCVDTGGQTANGSALQLWGSGGSYNQQWKFGN